MNIGREASIKAEVARRLAERKLRLQLVPAGAVATTPVQIELKRLVGANNWEAYDRFCNLDAYETPVMFASNRLQAMFESSALAPELQHLITPIAYWQSLQARGYFAIYDYANNCSHIFRPAVDAAEYLSEI